MGPHNVRMVLSNVMTLQNVFIKINKDFVIAMMN